MNEQDIQAIEKLSAAIKKLTTAEFITLSNDGLPPEFAAFVDTFNKLSGMLKEVSDLSHNLAQGSIDVPLPPRSNYLAMGLKVIHSQLMHINWQAEQIAAGDYTQSIDFMGEFGKTFNWAISSIKKQREEFESDRAMMLNLFDSLTFTIILIDPDLEKIVFNNKAASELCEGHTDLKKEKRDSLLTHLSHLCKEPPADKDKIIYFDPRVNRWFKIIMNATRWTQEKKVWLFYCIDITDEQLELEQMKEAAFDDITGLYVRVQGIHKIEALFAGLDPISKLVVVFFDLDGLKRVNDTIGHAAGDDLLKRFADAMKKTFRNIDVCIRMGGDEFVAAFTVKNDRFIDEVLHRFDDNVGLQNIGHEILVEYSRGYSIALYHEHTTVAKLIETADIRMYEQKKARKAAKGMKPEDR